MNMASSFLRDVETLRSRNVGAHATSYNPPPHQSPHIREENEGGDKHDEAASAENFDGPLGVSSPPSPILRHGTSANVAIPTHMSPSHAHSPIDENSKSNEEVQTEGEGEGGSQSEKPTSSRRYKMTAKRLVKRAAICKSPFVAQCLKQFPRIAYQDRVVADLAFAESSDPKYIYY